MTCLDRCVSHLLRLSSPIIAMATFSILSWANLKADDESTSPEEKRNTEEKWNVDSPPGESFEQSIDVTEGTWINLDVSPDGTEIVFDLLGDLYTMPIEGADGSEDVSPKRITDGIAWDMQPRYSPDGSSIAFTSDRTGSNDRGGDNIWIMDRDGSNVRSVTNETFRLLNGPTWSPDGQYIVARKHFSGDDPWAPAKCGCFIVRPPTRMPPAVCN